MPSGICYTLVYSNSGLCIESELIQLLGYVSDFSSTSLLIIMVNIKFYKEQMKSINYVLTKLALAGDGNLN